MAVSLPAIPVQVLSFILAQEGVPIVAVDPNQLFHRRRLHTHLRKILSLTPFWEFEKIFISMSPPLS